MHRNEDKLAYSALRGADWIALAAAPTFAIMALLTRVYGSDMICGMGPDTSLLTGMVPMYLLMGLFHSSPWFKLLGRTRELAANRISQSRR